LRTIDKKAYFIGFSAEMAKALSRKKCLDGRMDDVIQPNELLQFLKRRIKTELSKE